MNYKGNEQAFRYAGEKLAELISRRRSIEEVKTAGKCIDFVLKDQTNVEFIPTAEDTHSGTNEYFDVDQSAVLERLSNHGAIDFKGVHCTVYGSGGGKGERDYNIWVQYYINAEKVLELYNNDELQKMTAPIV